MSAGCAVMAMQMAAARLRKGLYGIWRSGAWQALIVRFSAALDALLVSLSRHTQLKASATISTDTPFCALALRR